MFLCVTVSADDLKFPWKLIQKKQEQGAVPVNDRSEMTAESTGMQGKGSVQAFQIQKV